MTNPLRLEGGKTKTERALADRKSAVWTVFFREEVWKRREVEAFLLYPRALFP
jgi:hypothetical protein